MFSRIIAAYDDSPGARRALDLAVSLALGDGADLWLVAVEPQAPQYGATIGEVEAEQEFNDDRCRRWLQAGCIRARQSGVEATPLVRRGHPAQQIVHAAEQHQADLVVLGHSGHSAVWGRFLGSTADKVSRHAHCSVLIAAPAEGRTQPGPTAQ